MPAIPIRYDWVSEARLQFGSVSASSRMTRSTWAGWPLAFTAGVVGFSVLIFVFIWLIAAQHGVPLKALTRDAATSHGGPFHGGYLSNLGMFLWGITTGAAIFTGCFLRHFRSSSAGFLLATGMLTLLLYVDDLFLIHDGLAPATIKRGDKTLFLVYGLCSLGWLWTYRRNVLASPWISLLLSIGCFAIALICDIEVFQLPGDLHYVLEDGFKLLGIAAWTGYVIPVCWIELARLLQPEGRTA